MFINLSYCGKRMNERQPVYCGHCKRWLKKNPPNYCNNSTNSCFNYNEVFFTVKIFRKLSHGVPLTHSLENLTVK
jgi:hypothetical protein